MLTQKLDRVAWWVIAALLLILPFHAFLWTYFHSFFWTESWTVFVQAWKEILIGLLGLLAFIKLITTRQFSKAKSFWIGLILVLLATGYAIFGDGELSQKVLGLRSATIFIVALLAVQFFEFKDDDFQKLIKIVLFSASLVILFALLHQFVLPDDILKNFGYSENVSSWLPGGNLPMYHLVGGDADVIRAQSTFAGPNQLGAYLLVVLPLTVLLGRSQKIAWETLSVFIILGGLTVLFFTYSRSAWVGLALIIFALFIQVWRFSLSKKMKIPLLTIIVIVGITAGLLISAQPKFRDVIVRYGSTSEHLQRSVDAAKLVIDQPLGLGLGQTAGVSQRYDETHQGITPENTYLSFALELGWFGGLLFLAFMLANLIELYRKNSPLFYSLLGIAAIAFFLHPLEDMPTALTLFLLAGTSIRN